MTRELSPREEEIVNLSVGGLTNDEIARRLGLSVGTVNTYWLRIRLKVGGTGRTDTVAKVITEQAERTLHAIEAERENLALQMSDQGHRALELHAALAMLHLALQQIESTVWACDANLTVQLIVNEQATALCCGGVLAECKTVYEIFRTEDRAHPAVAAHLSALAGKPQMVPLTADDREMLLRVQPLKDDRDQILGCVSILNVGT